MKSKHALILLPFFASLFSPAFADFGDADFPEELFKDGPKSYHDAWCRWLKNKCRVRFQGPGMWVEGQGGIQASQYIKYRNDIDGGEYYNYITYRGNNGKEKQALFLFANRGAQKNFVKALFRWKRQDALPYPNFRMPYSQGPQDTQGRDKGLNPYENPPITDWSKKTTKELKEICRTSPYRKSPVCRSFR